MSSLYYMSFLCLSALEKSSAQYQTQEIFCKEQQWCISEHNWKKFESSSFVIICTFEKLYFKPTIIFENVLHLQTTTELPYKSCLFCCLCIIFFFNAPL